MISSLTPTDAIDYAYFCADRLIPIAITEGSVRLARHLGVRSDWRTACFQTVSTPGSYVLYRWIDP